MGPAWLRKPRRYWRGRLVAWRLGGPASSSGSSGSSLARLIGRRGRGPRHCHGIALGSVQQGSDGVGAGRLESESTVRPRSSVLAGRGCVCQASSRGPSLFTLQQPASGTRVSLRAGVGGCTPPLSALTRRDAERQTAPVIGREEADWRGRGAWRGLADGAGRVGAGSSRARAANNRGRTGGSRAVAVFALRRIRTAGLARPAPPGHPAEAPTFSIMKMMKSSCSAP